MSSQKKWAKPNVAKGDAIRVWKAGRKELPKEAYRNLKTHVLEALDYSDPDAANVENFKELLDEILSCITGDPQRIFDVLLGVVKALTLRAVVNAMLSMLHQVLGGDDLCRVLDHVLAEVDGIVTDTVLTKWKEDWREKGFLQVSSSSASHTPAPVWTHDDTKDIGVVHVWPSPDVREYLRDSDTVKSGHRILVQKYPTWGDADDQVKAELEERGVEVLFSKTPEYRETKQMPLPSRDELIQGVRKEVKEKVLAQLGSATESEGKRVVVFERLHVQGLGPFVDKVSYELNVTGVTLIGAKLRGMNSNGFGKTTLCVTAFVWVMSGLLDVHVSEVNAAKDKDGRKIADLWHDKCCGVVTGHVTAQDEKAVTFRVKRERKGAKMICTVEIGDKTIKEERDALIQLGQLLYGQKLDVGVGGKQTTVLTSARRAMRNCILDTHVWSPFSGVALMPDSKQEFQSKSRVLNDVQWLKTESTLKEESGALKKQHAAMRDAEKDSLVMAQAQLKAAKVQTAAKTKRKKETDKQKNTQFTGKEVSLVKLLELEIDQLKQDRTECERKLTLRESEVTKCRATEKDTQENYHDTKTRLSVATHKHSEGEKEVDAVSQLVAKCPTCKQEVKEDYKQLLKSKAEKRLKELQEQLDEVDALNEAAKQEHDFAVAATKAATKEVKQLTKQKQTIANKISAKEKKVVKLKPAADDYTNALRAAENAEEERKKAVAEEKKMKDAVDSTIESNTEAQASRGEEKAVLEEAITACSKARRRLLEHGCAQLDNMINTWLERFYAHLRDLKPHFTVKTALDSEQFGLEVNIGGKSRKPSALSTAEFARLRLALFFAFIDLQSSFLRVNFILMDECFLGLDEYGVLGVLTSMRRWCHENERCLCMSTILPFHHLNMQLDRHIVLIPDDEPDQHGMRHFRVKFSSPPATEEVSVGQKRNRGVSGAVSAEAGTNMAEQATPTRKKRAVKESNAGDQGTTATVKLEPEASPPSTVEEHNPTSTSAKRPAVKSKTKASQATTVTTRSSRKKRKKR